MFMFLNLVQSTFGTPNTTNTTNQPQAQAQPLNIALFATVKAKGGANLSESLEFPLEKGSYNAVIVGDLKELEIKRDNNTPVRAVQVSIQLNDTACGAFNGQTFDVIADSVSFQAKNPQLGSECRVTVSYYRNKANQRRKSAKVSV